MSTEHLLGDGRIRNLALAELASSLGGGIVALTITFVTFQSTGSLLRTVMVTAAYSLPAALFGVPAGHLADRYDRRRLLVLLYSLKASTYLVMAALGVAGILDANWLLATSFLAGTLSALVFPAWEEYEKDLIPPEQLASVNALFSSMGSVAGLIGALAGGVIVATIGSTTAFLIDAVSFVPLLFVIALTRPKQVVVRHRGHGPHDLRRTIGVIWSTGQLRRAIRNVAMLSLLAAPVVQLLPAIAKAIDPSATTLGFVTAAYALGGATVAWAITRLQKYFDRAGIVELSFFVCSFAFFAFGLGGIAANGVSLYGLIVLTLLPVGLTLSLAQSVISAILQIHSPDEVEGEIFAIYGVMYSVFAPLGGLLLSRLTDSLDVFGVVALTGVVLLGFSSYLAVTLSRARQRGEIPPTCDHRLVLAHHGLSGPAGGLWMHHHLRTSLAVGRRQTTRAADSPISGS